MMWTNVEDSWFINGKHPEDMGIKLVVWSDW